MSIVSMSPWDPSDVVAEVASSSLADVDARLVRARAAQCAWRAAAPGHRAAALGRFADALESQADELARLVTREVGKPATEARAEVARGVAILRYNAQLALAPDGRTYPGSGGMLVSRRRPRGVAALITPWNFPVAIPLWKAAPAMAVGNTVVVKPASQAVATMMAIEECATSALPDGVFTVLPGGAEVAEYLVDHGGVDCVSFTGSEAVGVSVVERATRAGTPVQAELGGHNPAVVLPGADLDAVAHMVAAAAMGYAGQKCTATSRIVVLDEIAEPFLDHLVSATEKLPIGDPSDPHTLVGPVISDRARSDALAAVAAARARGGQLLTGGEALAEGHTMQPTLVHVASVGDELACEEVFAPVAAVVVVPDVAEAVAAANAGRYGLSAGVYTSDLSVALDVANQLDAGMIRVNQPTSGVDLHAPFGGIKASSHGPREQGPDGPDFYTTVHTLSIGPAA